MSKIVSKFPGFKIRTNLKKKCLEVFQLLNTQDTDLIFFFFFTPEFCPLLIQGDKNW